MARVVAVEFRVLGSFEVVADGRDATPSAPKLRQALALMVLEHNKIVHTHSLIDELWGESPPRQATRTVHTYIYELRRGLQPFGHLDEMLATRPNGYMAVVPPETIDLNVSDALVRRAGVALADKDPDTARQLLSEALVLWRGQALSNVSCGKLLEAFATRLEESWLQALEMRIEADFQLNRHHELVGELKALSANHQFHEGIHGKLMLALYRCGRRNEALEVYRCLHHRLADELGLGPGAQIQRLQQLMLAADPALEPPSIRRAVAAPAPVVPPAQLPPDITDFIGRQDVIAKVRGVLDSHRDDTAVPIVSITGMPGVGKTTTAVHIAHAVRGDFPDGQLYVSLGGSRGVPEDPTQVLALFLRSVGISADMLESLNDRVAAFRTWTSGRRVLMLLDDADSTAQVEPLLPAGQHCAAIVTNRFPLYGLPSVLPVRLGTVDVDEGAELLARIVGRDRVEHERAAAADIVRMVGGLPLAIRFLGQRLASVRPHRLDQFVQRLTEADGRYRLSDLAYVGMDLRARLEASYRKLSERDRSAFRLLAVLRGSTFTADDAAGVFRMDVAAAEITLLRLVDAQLVQVDGGDPAGRRRYGLHELVRPYTLECIAADPALETVSGR
jgi:DNA-binding SARP family transcriptional activator